MRRATCGRWRSRRCWASAADARGGPPGVGGGPRAGGGGGGGGAPGGGPPLLDARSMQPKRGELQGCRASTRLVMGEIAADPKLKLIVLSSRWALYNGDKPY